MYMPTQLEDTNQRAVIDAWKGYNHNYRIGGGEWYDCENLSSDGYPLMTPRKRRAKLIAGENIRGIILTDNVLCYLQGKTLYYGGAEYDLSEYDNTDGVDDQTLIRFGAYILIYPVGIYINLNDPEERGNMSVSYTTPEDITITYSMCDVNGEPFSRITAGTTAPANPQDGDYWLCTDPDAQGLNMWVASVMMWQPVATTYIKINIPGGTLRRYFEEGDVVTLTSGLPDINEGSEIIVLDNENMVITGILPNSVTYTEATDSVWQLQIARLMPDLDYVCQCGNRVWGCRYGSDGNGGTLNEIYSSALGDFRNWYKYTGLTTDSYAVSVGEDGVWTGCIAYQGHPVFFKENHIYTIYGSYPAEYQLYIKSARGVQQGSYRSLAIVNEYLLYKSAADVVVYDGTNPVSISQPLGRDTHFYDAVAGGTLGKYYIQMQTIRGRYYYFVYDMATNLWMREDADIHIHEFTTSESGQIYAHTGSEIYGIGSNDNSLFLHQLVGEEYVQWWAETGDIGIEFPDQKKISRLQIRAYVPAKSEIQVWVSFDGQQFEEKGVIRGTDSIRTAVISFSPMPCDTYRIRFVGHGDVRIYTMTTTYDSDGGLYGRRDV